MKQGRIRAINDKDLAQALANHQQRLNELTAYANVDNARAKRTLYYILALASVCALDAGLRAWPVVELWLEVK